MATLKNKNSYVDYVTAPGAEGNSPYVYVDSTCHMTVGVGINIAGTDFRTFRNNLFGDSTNFNMGQLESLPASAKNEVTKKLDTVFNNIINKIRDDDNAVAPCNYKATGYDPAKIGVKFKNAVGGDELYNFNLSAKGEQLVMNEFNTRLDFALTLASTRYTETIVAGAKYKNWDDLPYHAQWYFVDRTYNIGHPPGYKVIEAAKKGDWDTVQTEGWLNQNPVREAILAQWLFLAKTEDMAPVKQVVPNMMIKIPSLQDLLPFLLPF